MLKTIGILLIIIVLFGGTLSDVLLWVQHAVGVLLAWAIAFGIWKVIGILLLIGFIRWVLKVLFHW
ncbi:MAG: hypothetical protein IJX99_04775 [Clostridia bacterium]|nr:hypothetical protein [Clostridia bacterium]